MALAVTFDKHLFDRALVEYAVATGKDLNAVVNRAAKNVAFRTAQFMPKAVRSRIETLESEPWWPKYIAKRLSTMGSIQLSLVRKRDRRALGGGGLTYTRDMARRYSRRVLGSRKSAVGFMRSGFVKSARALGHQQGGGNVDRFTSSQGTGELAQGGQHVARIAVTYLTKRGVADAKAKEFIASRPFQKSMDFVAKDMMEHATTLARTRGRAHSAK